MLTTALISVRLLWLQHQSIHPRPGSESELELVLEPDPELLESSSESSELLLLLLALNRDDLGSAVPLVLSIVEREERVRVSWVLQVLISREGKEAGTITD